MTTLTEALRLARKHLDDDPHLSNYVLRDRLEVKELGLDDYCWGLHRDGNVSKNDVLLIIERLEKALSDAIPD